MIETSTLFSQSIANSSRQFRAKLLESGAEVPGTIRSITINKGACGEENFSVGSVYSSYIELVMDECDDALQDKEVQLQIGIVLADESVEYATIGYYTVTKPTRTAYQLKFTAVGRIAAKLNELPALPEVQTIDALAKAITAKTGVPIVFKGLTASGTIEENLLGLTCKEILSVIAVTLGGYATEDSHGNIVVCKFSTENPINYNGDQTLVLPEFKDYDYELYGVKVIVSEAGTTEEDEPIDEVSFTRGTPRMTISTKYMTASLFEAFADNLIGYKFRPGTVPLALGDPRLEPWDVLRFTDVKGKEYVVPCLNLVHSFDGGLSTVVTAPGESESEAETTQKGPLVAQVERVAAELVTAQEAILKRLRADEIITDDITSSTGSFTKWLTGVRIVGDLIEAGTLKADTLILKGEDGLYYKLNTEGGVVPGSGITAEDLQKGLSGSVIVANTITAEKINVDDLVAFDATIGGFDITKSSLYSGSKGTIDSTATGTYLDSTGQFCFGDANSYLMGFIDKVTGEYKIVINANDIILRGKNVSIETAIEESVQEALDEAKASGVFDGEDGDDGKGITSTAIDYQKSTRGTTVPTGTWQTSIPSLSPGEYLWTRTTISYTTGNPSVSYSVGRSGNDGDDGKGISSTEITYQTSTSGTTAPTGTWQTSIPSVAEGSYLWTRTVITYTDNTTSTSYSVGRNGTNGGEGDNGKDGQMLYATSSTAAGTAAKVATLSAGTLALAAGSTVSVKFTYANTAVNPTLNIANAGAKAVYTNGVRYAYWTAGQTVTFTYDGSNWQVASTPVYANTATVGNSAGRNVYIDSDAVHIKNGTNTLASFGADISLLNGKGTISADSYDFEDGGSRDSLFVGSQNLIMSGEAVGISASSLYDKEISVGDPTYADITALGASDNTIAQTKLKAVHGPSGKRAEMALYADATSAELELFFYNPSGYKQLYINGSEAQFYMDVIAENKLTVNGEVTVNKGMSVVGLSASGDISGQKITGTGLKVTGATAETTAARIATLTTAGDMKYITPANLLSTIGALSTSGGTISGALTVTGALTANGGVTANTIQKNGMPVAPVCSGYLDPGSIAKASYADFDITFPFTFKSTPNVIACFLSTSTEADFANCLIAVSSRTTTGAKIRVFNNSSSGRSPDIFWIATQN